MKTFFKSLIGISLVLITSCGSDGTKSANEVGLQTYSTEKSELDGKWESPCDPFIFETSQNHQLEVNQGSFIEHLNYYDGRECQTLSSTIEFTGYFSLGNTVQSPANSKELNLKIATFSSVYHDDKAVKRANDDKLCGITDWKKGEKRLCSQTNLIIYQVYKLENDSLWMGQLSKERDGASADRRPNTLEKTPMTRSTK